jgi:hypothetical protein
VHSISTRACSTSDWPEDRIDLSVAGTVELAAFGPVQLNRVGPRTLAAFKYLVEQGEPLRVKHAQLPRVAATC